MYLQLSETDVRNRTKQIIYLKYSKTGLKGPLNNRQSKDLNDKWYSLMKVESIAEHSAILLICIKQYSVLKAIFDLLFKWPLKTGFTVK